MFLTIAEIAKRLNAKVEGDGNIQVSAVTSIEDAGPGDITFVARPQYSTAAAGTKASAVVVPENWTGKCPATLIRTKDPDGAFAEIASWLVPPEPLPAPGIHPTAIIAKNAQLGTGVSIGAYCVVEPDVKIGDRSVMYAHCYIGRGTVVGCDCKFYPQVSMRERTRIGNRVIIHNGAVIGSDGFGYTRKEDKWHKISQVGIVVIGDDVEIGANTTIDRARFGETRIGNGVKIDNLVQVAHNVQIGDNTAIAAQVGIAGSTRIGRNVQIGGQAGFAGHINIGDRSVVGAQAGVTKDVPPGIFVSGYPAVQHDKATKIHAHVMRLPELKEKVASLEKRVDEIERKSDERENETADEHG